MTAPASPAPPAGGALLVLSDSLAYYGPDGGLPADDPRIWPNLVGAALRRRVELFGRIGWTTRDVWWALTQDPRVWAAIPAADVVVLAIGGMDTLPSPVPTALREQIRYIRPAWLRQRVRELYGWVQPALSPVGWPLALPASVTVDYLDRIHGAIVAVRPGLPFLLCLPPTHSSPYYRRIHRARAGHTTAMRRWARDRGVATVDFYPATAARFAAHDAGVTDDDTRQNADGIHWGLACHRDIAEVVIAGLHGVGAPPRTSSAAARVAAPAPTAPLP